MANVVMLPNGPKTIFDNRDFASAISDFMGTESAEYFVSALQAEKDSVPKCTGECDATYRIQEHYQTLLLDIAGDLNEILEMIPESVKVRKVSDFDSRVSMILKKIYGNI